jgi:hypothetical protein
MRDHPDQEQRRWQPFHEVTIREVEGLTGATEHQWCVWQVPGGPRLLGSGMTATREEAEAAARAWLQNEGSR